MIATETIHNVATGEVTVVEFDDGIPEPTEAELRAEWRETARLTFSELVPALAEAGFITKAEGRDWLRGNDLPALANVVVASLPEDQQLRVEAKLLRMQNAYRLDETTLVLVEVKW